MIAVFDIGKTNKKFFLFDSEGREVYKSACQFEEIQDEDGFPCDNLPAIEVWVKQTFEQAFSNPSYDIQALNISGHGASFVHIDKRGKAIMPTVNYLKPIPKEILDQFYEKYGDPNRIARETASPPLGMLNSGLQLYWLKYAKPALFKQIKWSLHLPQYFSFLFTGLPLSDYTSIGCHTALWDYEKNDYHRWVYEEEIDRILAPIVPTDLSFNKKISGRPIKLGVGIHDSSGALLPYLMSDPAPFVLLSTGTWSIALNPYSKGILSEVDLQNDCLNFLRVDGKPVKASRLFLGNEYALQVAQLCMNYHKGAGYDRQVKLDEALLRSVTEIKRAHFRFNSIRLEREQAPFNILDPFPTFEAAYHRLMWELMDLQVQAIQRIIDPDAPIEKIYVDGGFADNDIFTNLLRRRFPEYQIFATPTPLGSALGAARIVA